ncbi:D-alanyl-D-alanine carboxypeptidase [Streptomyces sp. GESEQ-35]|uniref:D-alanyl-D-alanine carboxypeptidase n=1 Tax=Streptomyces sp. GESEQ-35 TaxID=2812657 RepID=UPI001B325D46|nr:D-alanyl-D-alanine carboxypeptidase [Streptomyces sp. GESEQ-35]
MEEASVAGESPDRSKQRESSAEPTSGSASPVPEARSGAADPRLAVAREAGTAASTSSSEARGGVDTATKIFSVRDLPKDVREVEGEVEAGAGAGGGGDESEGGGAEGVAGPEGSSVGPEGSSASPGDSSAGSEDPSAGDAANAAGDAGDDAAAGDGGGAVGDGGDAVGYGADDAGGVADAADDAGDAAGDGADAASGAGDAADDGGNDAGAVADAAGDAEDDAGNATGAVSDAGDAAGDGANAGGDDRLRAAVAAWVAGADGEPSETDAEAEVADVVASEEGDAGDVVASESGEDADGGVVTSEGADEGVEGGDEAAGEAEAAAGGDAAAEADAEPETEGDAETGADAEPETEGDAEVDAEPEVEGDAEAGAGSDGEAASEGVADSDAEPQDETGTDTDEADAEPEAGSDGEAVSAGVADSDAEPQDETGTDTDEVDADADTDADKHPVDQPTGVFRAVRPSAPAVDQPTTMLKLGDAAKPTAPEAEVERTSKFVALKPLDEPRPDAAKPATPDATRSVPQVGPERTTQQPLPPKPPLDLLAELTNTPPPPQTPLRTAARRVKIWTPLVLLLAVVFAVVQAVRPLPTPELALTAEDSYTFDGSKVDLPWPGEGQGWMDVNGIGTMGNFGEQKPVAIGSVAKAMTAYVVLKDHPLKPGQEGPGITVDALAEKEGGYDKDDESTLNTVKAGDKLSLKQALSAIMIPSANNIARLLARWDAGSEKAFIEKMNDAAKELGMKNTTYTDASGLKESTVSTAEDQVKLGNELVEIQALVDITKLPYWDDPSGQRWNNYNKLVPYDGAIGIKTGTTTAAGGNLLYAGTKEIDGETVTVVGAILGQHTAPIIDTVNAVSKTAMLAAQEAITSAKILKKGDVVGYVDDQLGGKTPIVVTKDVSAVGWAGLKVKLSFASDEVPHSATAGTKVGTLTVGDGSGGAVEVPVALQTDLAEPGFTDKLTRLI